MRGTDRLSHRFGSFTARMLILSVLVSIVPLVVTGLVYDRYTRQMLVKLNEDRMARRLDEVAERVNVFIADRFSELEMLSDYPPLKAQLSSDLPPPRQDMIHAVIEYQADQTHLYGILLLSKTGEVVAAFAPTMARTIIDWQANAERLPFRQLHPYRARGLLGPETLVGVQSPVVFLYQRVYRDWEHHQPIGLVALHLEMSAFVSLIGADTDEAVVPYIRAPDGRLFSARPLAEGAPPQIVASRGLADGWELVIAMDESRLMAPLVDLRETLLGVFLGAISAILAVIWLFYLHGARRIRKLTEGAEAIAHGNLRWRLEDHGKDELGRLSGAFNRMAEQLQGLIDSAVQSEKMASLGKLATTIAHEVRNPLASIKTGVQVVLEDLRDRDQSRILRNVIAEIDRLNRVASDLLDFARPVKPQSRSASVVELVERVRALVERQASRMNVRIAVAVSPELSIRVDPNQMQQVLMNLVLNSLHAMPQGGELRLEARRQDHRVVIDVKDTGTGIEPDLLERVTAPFVSSRSDGAGIGLSVSNQLVESNQGRMEIRSAPNAGTTVSLSFPAA